MSENKILLEVQDLKKYFPVKGTKGPGVQAVESVSLFIHRGETLGLVGESGCGKTTLGRTILRLHEPTSGKIIYDGETIFERTLDAAGKPVGQKVAVNMLPYRRKMQIIFQDPSASLDPRMTVGEIIGEALDIHKLYGSKQERTDRIKELLGQVGLNTEHANRYPHEFSGGQQQRVGIARALAVDPQIIFADEPTGNLDSKTTMEVLKLMQTIVRERNQTLVMVTHDNNLATYADRIIKIIDGKIVSIEENHKEADLEAAREEGAQKNKDCKEAAREETPQKKMTEEKESGENL